MFAADTGYPEQGRVRGLGLHVSCSSSTGAPNGSRRGRFQYWNAYNFFSSGIFIFIENEYLNAYIHTIPSSFYTRLLLPDRVVICLLHRL